MDDNYKFKLFFLSLPTIVLNMHFWFYMKSPVNLNQTELNIFTLLTLTISLLCSIFDFIFNIYGIISSRHFNTMKALFIFHIKESIKIINTPKFQMGDFLMIIGIIFQLQLTGLHNGLFVLTDRIFTWEAAILMFVIWGLSLVINITLGFACNSNLNEFKDNKYVDILINNKMSLKMYDDNSKTYMWLYTAWSIFFRFVPLLILLSINIYLIVIRSVLGKLGLDMYAFIVVALIISCYSLVNLGVFHFKLIKNILDDDTFEFNVENQIYNVEKFKFRLF